MLYAFTKHKMWIAHMPKKWRAVIFIWTVYHSIEHNVKSRKPAIIPHYNNIKGGVDTVDEKNAK